MEQGQMYIVFNPHNLGKNRTKKRSRKIKMVKIYQKPDLSITKTASYAKHPAIGYDNSKNVNNYDKCRTFFSKYNVSKELLYKLFVDYNAKATMKSNYMEIFCHEDTWRIYPKSEDNKVDLWHNNYARTFSGERHFEKGYHRQILRRNTLVGALRYIMNYDYTKIHHSQKALNQNV